MTEIDVEAAIERVLQVFEGHYDPQKHKFLTPGEVAIALGYPPLARKDRRGRSPATNSHRNVIIMAAVDTIRKEFNIRPTRGSLQRKRDSACSIVCKALKRIGIESIDEAAVEYVWENGWRQLRGHRPS